MRGPRTAVVTCTFAAAMFVAAAFAAPSKSLRVKAVPRAPRDPQALRGWPLYNRFCLACHGARGDGHGPGAAYTWRSPRDFTKGAYQWRSTPFGEAPTDDDLRATLRFGAPGTSMPGFDGILSDTDLADVIAVVKAYSPAMFAAAGKPVKLGPPPAKNAARGARLWTQQGCDKCHGASGKGDEPGLAAPPYDLTALPLRRPRETDDADARRRAAALSIATGLGGTPMPGFAGTVSDTDLWALADHVVTLGANAAPADRSTLDAAAIEADRKAHIAMGTWPGNDPDEARVFGAPIAEQGAPPASLAPAQASLHERQCARCHAKQAREWQTSVHARASTWGLPARELDHAGEGDTACARCHTPLAEQQPASKSFDASLRDEGVTCAGCHVRDWVRRGPPNVSPSLLALPGYPLVELALYERSDLCMTCHQLPPRTAVNGKPMLNTYKEWLEGPYMRRGIQCQHCHMPSREHTWLGIHDRDTFRQAIRLDASAQRTGTTISVVAALTNIGAGHYLPTTTTPAITVRLELLDVRGTPLEGTRMEFRIARDMESTTAGWRERADTRIPPGETRTLRHASTGAATAATARVTVDVAPDDYYERLYTQRLATKLPAATRTAYEAALARAKSSRYSAEQMTVSITSR